MTLWTRKKDEDRAERSHAAMEKLRQVTALLEQTMAQLQERINDERAR